MKITKLYDGGFLILVGLVLVAIGLAALGTGVNRVNEKAKKEQEKNKPLIIFVPEKKKCPPCDPNPQKDPA